VIRSVLYMYLFCDSLTSFAHSLPFSLSHVYVCTHFHTSHNYFKHYSYNAIALNQSKFTSIIIMYNKLAHNHFSFLIDICCNNDFDRTVLLSYAYKISWQTRARAFFFFLNIFHCATLFSYNSARHL